MSKELTNRQIEEVKRSRQESMLKIQDKALPLRTMPTSLTSQTNTTSSSDKTKKGK